MENRFKLRITRMFRSSFGSCHTRKFSDVIDTAVSSTQRPNKFHLMEPSSTTSSPKTRPFSFICKSRCPESTHDAINHDAIMKTAKATLPRRKVSARHPPFVVSAADFDGRKCPPASPLLSPMNLFSDCKHSGFYDPMTSSTTQKKKKKKKKKRKNNKSVYVKRQSSFLSSSCREAATYNNNNNKYGNGWGFSSEDETETLFSSKTLSSDSSESFGRKHSTHRKRCNSSRRRRGKNRSCDMGFLPLEETTNNIKVKDSVAVVKCSSDPYNDFKTSMVEMIIERQIYAAKDLEQLLQCFLSLNSHHHHRIIVEVFTQICETLFSNWS